MLLEIDDGKTIGDLQENFNESFPYLKIQFYDRKYRGIKELHLLFPLMPDVLVGSIRKKHDPGIYTIKSWYKVGKVEDDLWEIFGLNARVLYNQANKWTFAKYSDTLASYTILIK